MNLPNHEDHLLQPVDGQSHDKEATHIGRAASRLCCSVWCKKSAQSEELDCWRHRVNEHTVHHFGYDKKANYSNMKAELKALEVDFCSSAATKEVEELWTIFKTHVHSLIEKHIPSKMLRGNKIHKPWISKQVKALIRRRNKLFQRQKKSNSQKDIKLYKEAKAKLQRAERQSYWQFVENIVEVGDPSQDQQPSKQKRFLVIHKVTSKGQQWSRTT